MVSKVIGLIGVRGSGKDYTAKMIQAGYEKFGWKVEILSFADSLRTHVFKKLGLQDLSSNPELYSKFKSTTFLVDGEEKTGREWLEDEGDIFTRRDLFHFVKEVQRKIEFSIADVVIIPDVRLGREVYGLKYLGILRDFVLDFQFCDFHSDRYDDLETQSNELALSLRDKGFKDGQDVTNQF